MEINKKPKKKLSLEHRLAISKGLIGHIVSNKTRIKLASYRGEKSSNWKGGISKRSGYWGRLSKQKEKVNIQYRVGRRMSNFLWWALKGRKNGRSWESIVGYSTDDLMKHLEKQFDNRMSWSNYGPYWHIDHIKPKSLFKYESELDEEFRKCWALDNLQPLEAKQNIKKHNHYYGN